MLSLGFDGLRMTRQGAGVSALSDTITGLFPASEVYTNLATEVPVEDGGGVGDWEGIAGAGGFSQSSVGNRPSVSTQYGYQAVSFDRTLTHHMDHTVTGAATDDFLICFSAVTTATPQDNNRILTVGTPGVNDFPNGTLGRYEFTGSKFVSDVSGDSGSPGFSMPALGSWAVYSIHATGGATKYRLNGTTEATNTCSPLLASGETLRVAYGMTAQPASIAFRAVLVVKGVVSDTDRDAAEAFIKAGVGL